MFFGLFRQKPKQVKVKRAKKTKTSNKIKVKKPKKTTKPKKNILKTKTKKVSKTRETKISKTKLAKKTKPSKTAKTTRPVKSKFPQLVAKVTHFFPRVNAGVIVVTSGTISLGDTLHIKGHTTDLKQKITSMQIDNVAITKAKKGDEIGILVKKHVRGNDLVYKL